MIQTISYVTLFAAILRGVKAASFDNEQNQSEFEVVLWASDLSEGTQASLLSCPYNVSLIGLGQEWTSNGMKLDLTLKYLREQKNQDKVVLFADSHDTLFQGGSSACPSPRQYTKMYWAHEADIIFQADGGCGWASSRVCGMYPRAEKPFLNSGVILSSVGALRATLEGTYPFLEASGERLDHDQAFWHRMFAQQHQHLEEGKPLSVRLAVDYSETYAGSSLAHFVASADDIFQHGGQLAYISREEPHVLGCILHAQGQSGSLIERDIHLKILKKYRSAFLPNAKKWIRMYTPFGNIRLH